MTRLRKVIAQRMVESLQVSAQLTTVVEVDVTKISRLRDRAKGDFQAREGVKLSFLPFFALAVVEALKTHPMVNASIDGDEITYHGAENLGIAVDTERGLLVPVIKDAGDLNIAGLARKIADLADRTRNNKIGPDELGGGTFTLTNTGSRGALSTRRSSTSRRSRSWAPAPSYAGRSSSPTRRAERRSRSGRWSTWRCPTTTGSSTVPTRPDSCPPSRNASRTALSSPIWASDKGFRPNISALRNVLNRSRSARMSTWTSRLRVPLA